MSALILTSSNIIPVNAIENEISVNDNTLSQDIFELTEIETSEKTEELFNYVLLDDGTVKLTTYNGLGENIIIPSEIDGYKVTVVGDNLFKNNLNITSVVISEGITTLGKYAFYNCKSLNNVILSNTVDTISANCFQKCSSLSSITIQKSLRYIKDYAFSECTNLKDVWYMGDQINWYFISIGSSGNSCLNKATIHYLKDIEEVCEITISPDTFVYDGTESM